jgi:hypothetical protein
MDSMHFRGILRGYFVGMVIGVVVQLDSLAIIPRPAVNIFPSKYIADFSFYPGSLLVLPPIEFESKGIFSLV